MNWQRGSQLDVEPWHVEDLRLVDMKGLFERLLRLGVPMDREHFALACNEVESPEELAELYTEESNSPQEEDQIYLLLFELWRRIYPERHTLSLFCDELDRRIDTYNLNPMDSGEAIQDALANLQELLYENCEAGVDPDEAIELLSPHLANDLRSFLHDFIHEELEENPTYAAELIEGFVCYMEGDLWFQFLQARLCLLSDVTEGNRLLGELLDILKKHPDLDLLLEISGFLAASADRHLFLRSVKQALKEIEVEEDLIELLEHCVHYYRCIDEEKKEQAAEDLIASRKAIAADKPLRGSDAAVSKVLGIIES
ncbi:MAG: hypothetical protein JSR80_06845 [Verrucomicrobia bacterium]|nr:hypothetical protein [Verrucomicrobiota bacterium]